MPSERLPRCRPTSLCLRATPCSAFIGSCCTFRRWPRGSGRMRCSICNWPRRADRPEMPCPRCAYAM
ncbi:hypothetical protein AB6724_15395 [Comamonas guangdongensis]|uniref:Uncharacterized protein n=1 Tax=Comamonas guangdongensis TaxID=510515 RepID=A0ABV3ZXV9_9BURK